jgi:hypothetical protein
MELKATLRAISNETRGYLKLLAGDFTEAEAAQVVGDGHGPNPLLWQLGHLACTEATVIELFSAGPERGLLVPDALRAVCATGSPAPTPDTSFPPLTELWALLHRTHECVLELLEGATLADLDRPPRVPHPYFHTLGQAVYEVALNENYHIGQIAALRKLLGKPRIM